MATDDGNDQGQQNPARQMLETARNDTAMWALNLPATEAAVLFRRGTRMTPDELASILGHTEPQALRWSLTTSTSSGRLRDDPDARQELLEAAEVFEPGSITWSEVLQTVAVSLHIEGDFDAAQAIYERLIRAAAAEGDEVTRALCQLNLVFIEFDKYDAAAALQRLREPRAWCEANRDKQWLLGFCRSVAGQVLLMNGRLDEAQAQLWSAENFLTDDERLRLENDVSIAMLDVARGRVWRGIKRLKLAFRQCKEEFDAGEIMHERAMALLALADATQGDRRTRRLAAALACLQRARDSTELVRRRDHPRRRRILQAMHGIAQEIGREELRNDCAVEIDAINTIQHAIA